MNMNANMLEQTELTPARKLLLFFKQRLVAPGAEGFDLFDDADADALAALIKRNRLEALMHTLPKFTAFRSVFHPAHLCRG